MQQMGKIENLSLFKYQKIVKKGLKPTKKVTEQYQILGKKEFDVQVKKSSAGEATRIGTKMLDSAF